MVKKPTISNEKIDDKCVICYQCIEESELYSICQQCNNPCHVDCLKNWFIIKKK